MSHASSSKICKYDVFLSFKGKYTRRTFVSHLYNALNQRGIHAFKDDERLKTGKSISCELLKAIEESRFAVVIFSKKYASSRWCLEELAHIVKCKNELEQIVIPVFYDVSPSDVRHQYPPFAKSFSKQEKKFKDDLEKVQRWRDAFAGAGKISGYHLQNFKDEADCIKKLVDDIFPKSLQVSSPFTESLVGMKSQVEEVTSLLNMESNDVRSIGIWGMGGIGKTEIASVLYQTYRHRFEADCFLSGVGTLYQKNGLTRLVEVVISKLLDEKMTLTSEHEGLNILKNRLRWKKVLFILDDVSHREQLEFLVGGLEWFGMGSRIILTARDKHLLISHVGNNVYEVQLFSVDEALELFSRHALREKTPKKDFMEFSREVVHYAGGIPLALKVLGSSFYRRDKKHWRDIINRLKRIPHNDILGKLRLSFDGLNKDEKEIFLDIAFLDIAEGYIIKLYVEVVCKSRGFQLIGIDYLIEKSLLSINIHNRIVMHNMIRDMGANVIREEYANSRIWLPEEVCDLFRGKLLTEKVESLCIPKGYNFEDDPVNYNNIFKRMQSCEDLVSLPNRLFESQQLEELHIDECSGLVELPISLGVQKKLVKLKINRCENLKKLPSSIHMESLRKLKISDCPKLDTFPEINGDMHSLTELTIESTGIRELPSSIGNLSVLTKLNLVGCEDLVSLPNNLCNLKNLQRFYLCGCKKLEKLPENIGHLQELETLDASETAISQPPPSITKLGKLTELRFSHVLQHVQHSSSFVFHQLPGLSSLIVLDLSNNNILGGLPEDLGSLTSLFYLNVSGSNTSCLPKSIKDLLHLVLLNVQFCQNLNELPGELPPNLEELSADYHLALKSIRGLVIKCLRLHSLYISCVVMKNPNTELP